MKKRILISTEQANAQLGAFFQEAGIELCQNYDQNLEYQFIVDDYLSEITNLPRIQTKVQIASTCEGNVRAFLDEKHLTADVVKALLTNYFGSAEFDLVDRYSQAYHNIYTLKIHDFLNMGYFIDTIVIEAYKSNFDFEKIRNFLNSTLTHALKLVEKLEDHSPLDVSFSYSDVGFAIDISLNAPENSFKKDLTSLKNLSSNTNYFDLNYFQKRERLSFSALWFKEEKLRTHKSFFFTEVALRTDSESSAEVINRMDEAGEPIFYEPKKVNNDEALKLKLARKFTLFIKNYRSNEEIPPELSSLTLEGIDDYLTHYPRQEAIKELDDEIKNFIIKLLCDDDLYNGLSEYVQNIANSNLDAHMSSIQTILGSKSLADISEVLRIKDGKTDDDSNDQTALKGWSDNLNEEEWKVKRSRLVDKIEKEVKIIKGGGKKVVEDDILRAVSSQLDVNSEDVSAFIKAIVEEAVINEVLQKEKLEEVLTRHFENGKVNHANISAREKLEGQVVRMKKIMEQMKLEMIKMRAELVETKAVNKVSDLSDSQHLELSELKNALKKTVEIMKNKEKMAAKQRSDLELIIQSKDERAKALEDRIKALKVDFSNSSDHTNEEKLEQMLAENKSLTARLDLANNKINIISDNMDKKDNDSTAKKDKEILILKRNIQMAQSLIEKFKQERIDVEAKLFEEREKYAKLRDEKPMVTVVKDSEQIAQLQNITTDKKILEEKYKLQSIELKKLEQKLKFSLAQLDESQRKKAAPAASAVKSNEVYIKQLESANARIADAATDLAERKKEILKLKQENNIMATKLAEVEKKLSNTEKKAA